MEKPPSFDITFFVTCFNEEKNAVPTMEAIQKAMSARALTYEIIIFDDGSTDQTADNIQAYVSSHPTASITFIRNERNQGLGTNYVTGTHMAKGMYYMMVCGDNDTPLPTLNFMLDQVGKADMIIPYLNNMNERPFGRRFFSSLFTAIVGNITGSHLRYYNGIVIHRTATLRAFTSRASGFAYQAEILCQAVANGVSYLEVPVRTNAHAGFLNTSAFRLPNVISVTGSLWRMLWDRKYHTKKKSNPRS